MANACKAAIKSLNSKQKLAVQGSGNQGFGNGDAGRDLCFAHVTHRYKFLPVPGFPQLKISVAGQPIRKHVDHAGQPNLPAPLLNEKFRDEVTAIGIAAPAKAFP